jgi:integrase/recombinase XerD
MYHRDEDIKIIAEFLESTRKKVRTIPLSKAIEGFMLACHARQLSSHTIEDYQRTLRKFLKHTGDMPINQIGTTQITAFLGAQKVGKKTVLNYHIGLSALWTWALKEEYVEKHIIRLVEKPKPPQIVIEPFTDVEVRALLQAIRYAPMKNRALILTLLDTGGRASDIVNIRKEDIDFTKRHIKIRNGKGDKQRLLPFSTRTGSALFAHVSNCEEDHPFGESRHGLAQYLRRLGNRAGVKNVHPHRFRHTFAVTALRNGMNIYVLQDILGHSTLDMVKRYLALAETDLDDAHRKSSPVENWKL